MNAMKKLGVIAIAVLGLFLVMSCLALAGDIKTDISGHTYSVELGGSVYEIRFWQGPFGPGPCGVAELITEGVVVATYDFNARGELVIVSGLANFYYRDWQLIWIQDQLLVLDGVKSNE